jgi:hypothetical protein
MYWRIVSVGSFDRPVPTNTDRCFPKRAWIHHTVEHERARDQGDAVVSDLHGINGGAVRWLTDIRNFSRARISI